MQNTMVDIPRKRPGLVTVLSILLVGHLPFAMGMCDAEQKRVEGEQPCPVQHRSR